MASRAGDSDIARIKLAICPNHVPGGQRGIWIASALFTVALGSWVAVFPGTLEEFLGLSYDFRATWGCRIRHISYNGAREPGFRG